MGGIKPSEKSEDSNTSPKNDHHKVRECNKDTVTTDLATLINAQSNEIRTYREQRRRDDQKRSFREWLTITLLAMICVANNYVLRAPLGSF